MSEYDGWGYDLVTKQVELFENGIKNPVATLKVQDLMDCIIKEGKVHDVMELLLEKSGWVKRTESGEGVVARKNDS